jgi:hypothetical protein
MSFTTSTRYALACLAVSAPLGAAAKPIAFQDGWTVMGEIGTDTMREAQVFYAPKYWWSGGLSFTRITAHDERFERDIPNVQLNYLVHRWNLPAAQANVFAWGGLGAARGYDLVEAPGGGHAHVPGTLERARFSGLATWHAGAQVDYETRRIYSSLKTDWFRASRFRHRVDTLQLGVAPYEHDYEDLAVWFLVQARRISGDVMERRTEWIPMVRLFKGNFWIEAGANRDRRAQVMVMMNF